MQRIILHIDVNSAFLSWSALKLLEEGYKKDIRKEVSVIAGDPNKRHGIIVAASIPAKKLGIKSPSNLYDARKIYKDLIVVKPDMYYYHKKSCELMNLLNSLFDKVEQYSVDECFVDYTSYKKIYGNEVKYAYKLKDEIYNKFGFTVNIGIGNNKLSAKMASDFEKPNKVHTLYSSEFKEKVWPLDISDLFMAGKSACKTLRELNINTIEELATADKNMLIRHLKSHGKLLWEYANNIDNSELNTDRYNDRKGIGFSRTLEYDMDKKDEIYKYLYNFSKWISSELKRKNVYANSITVTIRNNEFKTYNHGHKYINGLKDENDIYEKAIELFNQTWKKEPIRLIGLRAADFTDSNNYQISLFEEIKDLKKDNKTDKIIEDINNKYGKNIIKKGL